MHFYILHNKTNIESWCQKVLDLLDLMFAEQFVILWNYMEHFLGCFSIISSNEGGNK